MSSPKPNFVDVSNQGRKSIIWQYLLLAKEKDLAKQKLSSKPAKAAETTEKFNPKSTKYSNIFPAK